MEVLCDPRAVPPDQVVANRDDMATIQQLLDAIDHREATILRLRFGLEGDEPLTLKEVGKRVGLTRERVRQIEIEALDKLNRRIQSRNPFSDEHEPPKRRKRRAAGRNGSAPKAASPAPKKPRKGEAA
jgi:RNA polymerase primary sigma factor